MKKQPKSFLPLAIAVSFIVLAILLSGIISASDLKLAAAPGPEMKQTSTDKRNPTVVNIAISRDGSVVYFDGKGKRIPIEKAKPVNLKTKVYGSFVFLKNVSLFTVKGSPIEVYVDFGDTVYCLVIDDATGEFLGFCD